MGAWRIRMGSDMSNEFNSWVSMSQVFKNELWPFIKDGTPAVTFPDINNIDPATVEFFNTVYDEGAVDRLYKQWNAAGREYKLWSIYSTKPDNLSTIKGDLDMLIASYPQDFGVLGAWNYATGQEVGAANPPIWYPIPPQTLNFMPDIVTDNTDPENPIYGPATELRDVLLVFGQANRDFDSFGA